MYTALVLATVLACAYAAPAVKSPCDQFEYLPSGVPGKWSGTLNVLTDYKLYGTWIRLIFDRPVKSVEVEGDSSLEMAANDEILTNEVLVKNREFIIKKGEPVKIPFTVSYEGGDAPILMGYRLNGRDVCPGLD